MAVKNLTVKQLHAELSKVIEQGYGDKEINAWCDCGYSAAICGVEKFIHSNGTTTIQTLNKEQSHKRVVS
jgi:hypothetical protein